MIKRVLSLLVTVAVLSNTLFAQSVEQGKKFLYYERYKSAKDNFQKVLAANPNDIGAVYGLGQTLLEENDTTGAKDVFQKALATNGNAPLLLVGMGQIELMEGKTDDARQRFETALNLTKGKDLEVLNAIARANIYAKAGDANYALEKLNLATQIKKFNDPETYLLMGDAYRKIGDGGNAVISYNKALSIDPKLAAAKVRIGRIYLTQNNPETFLPAFEEATQLDPAYAPAYNELFYYWYFRDVNKAGPYLDKYIANTDQGPEMEYTKTDYTYAKGDFAGANKRAQELISQYGDKVNPRMFRMVAYTADTLGDANAAKTAMTTFLSKADTSAILPADYQELSKINSKIPGSEQEAFANLEQAIAKDTVEANKVKYMGEAAALAKKLGDRNQQAIWMGKAYMMQKNPGQTDLYNWGYANYQAGNYKTADSIFCGMYQSKYPNEIYGYLWCARSKQAQDTTMQQGLAVDAYKTLAQKAVELDSAGKFKAQAIAANFYLVQYYNDIAKNKDTAIAYLDKVLAIDPTNADAIRVKEILTKPAKQPAAKPKATTGSKSTGSKKG
jgi:tetratricopeptide (TPR) repeat protein